MDISTERLKLMELDQSMAEALHLLSLDEDNRRFVPDEVFETVEDAQETIDYLIGCYDTGKGPQVYGVKLANDTLIGYVQAVPLEEGYEIGYHIGKAYTSCGYATEAVKMFLPWIMNKLGLNTMIGVCLAENIASVKVMERCGFVKVFEGAGRYQGNERKICRFEFSI